MSMNYDYNPESFQYSSIQAEPMWDYANNYVGVDSPPVNAQQFWGFGRPFFGGPFFRPFPFGRFGHPFFGSPFFFRRPWGGWW